jgi:hypothetical protein
MAQNVEHRRIHHAAHALGGGAGWDLDEWHAVQHWNDARPDTVPGDANKSHGYINRDGTQVVIYTRRAPFGAGTCQYCNVV